MQTLLLSAMVGALATKNLPEGRYVGTNASSSDEAATQIENTYRQTAQSHVTDHDLEMMSARIEANAFVTNPLDIDPHAAIHVQHDRGGPVTQTEGSDILTVPTPEVEVDGDEDDVQEYLNSGTHVNGVHDEQEHPELHDDDPMLQLTEDTDIAIKTEQGVATVNLPPTPDGYAYRLVRVGRDADGRVVYGDDPRWARTSEKDVPGDVKTATSTTVSVARTGGKLVLKGLRYAKLAKELKGPATLAATIAATTTTIETLAPIAIKGGRVAVTAVSSVASGAASVASGAAKVGSAVVSSGAAPHLAMAGGLGTGYAAIRYQENVVQPAKIAAQNAAWREADTAQKLAANAAISAEDMAERRALYKSLMAKHHAGEALPEAQTAWMRKVSTGQGLAGAGPVPASDVVDVAAMARNPQAGAVVAAVDDGAGVFAGGAGAARAAELATPAPLPAPSAPPPLPRPAPPSAAPLVEAVEEVVPAAKRFTGITNAATKAKTAGSQAIKNTGTRVANATRTAAKATGSAAKTGAKAFGKFALTGTGGAVIGGVIDTGVAVAEVTDTNNKYEAGIITESERNKDNAHSVGSAIGSTAGATIGTTVGATIGSFIPIPFVGTAVGGFVGGLLGGIFGGMGGGAAGDAVGNEINKGNPDRSGGERIDHEAFERANPGMILVGGMPTHRTPPQPPPPPPPPPAPPEPEGGGCAVM